jgi:hypothetical protein
MRASHRRCELAAAAGSRVPTPAARLAEQRAIRTQVRAFLAGHSADALRQMHPRQLCEHRWLLYRGDENYGLGNVLYDVSSAAALAMIFNRTLVYGTNHEERKFGTLLRWPGVLTLQEAEALRSRGRCGLTLAQRRRLVLAPDRSTLHAAAHKRRPPPPPALRSAGARSSGHGGGTALIRAAGAACSAATGAPSAHHCSSSRRHAPRRPRARVRVA